MRYRIFILTIIVSFGCQKTELPDNIIYNDIVPATVVSSVDTVYYIGYDDTGSIYKCGSLNSSGRYSIDLNEDNIVDLNIEHIFWEQEPFYGYSPHFWGDYYENIRIEINGLNGTMICGMNEQDLIEHQNGETFPQNSIGNIYCDTNISALNTWIENGIIYISSPGWLSFFESESQYIGVKVDTGNQELFGWIEIEIIEKVLNLPTEDDNGMAIAPGGTEWIKDLIVSGWALNMTDKKSILAGQIN
ncbi:MAG: hypothetical protein DRI94_01815 [Bacteroidetes bacterium]|nr:MAG: hypothetical protein DRI94_01815 [Bacteroidota bacterium]